jgi:hypothetical protein
MHLHPRFVGLKASWGTALLCWREKQRLAFHQWLQKPREVLFVPLGSRSRQAFDTAVRKRFCDRPEDVYRFYSEIYNRVFFKSGQTLTFDSVLVAAGIFLSPTHPILAQIASSIALIACLLQVPTLTVYFNAHNTNFGDPRSETEQLLKRIVWGSLLNNLAVALSVCAILAIALALANGIYRVLHLPIAR